MHNTQAGAAEKNKPAGIFTVKNYLQYFMLQVFTQNKTFETPQLLRVIFFISGRVSMKA